MIQPKTLPLNKWKPYPAYKDLGVVWLGKIPAHWEVKRIKHNSYVKGRIGWKGLTSDEFSDEGPYLVTGTDFINGHVSWGSCYHVSVDRYNDDPFIMLRENDLLITKDGTIGKTAILNKLPDKATLNSGIFLVRPNTVEYSTKFLYWVLSSYAFSVFIEFNKAGSTISHLYQNVFVEFKFPIPSIEEQSKISDFLDDETAKIDMLVAKKERQIELLQEKRIALISRAVTQGLDPAAPLKDPGIDWLGPIPAHWKLLSLRRVIVKFVDYRGATPAKTSIGIPLITARNIKNGYIDYGLSEEFISEEGYDSWMVRGLPEKGDVLITTEAPLGESAMIDDANIALAQRIILLKVDKTLLTNKYLNYYFSSQTAKKELWSRATGSTAIGIKAYKLKGILFTVPPVIEQKLINGYLDSETTKIDDLITKVRLGIERLKEYRTALISAAVTGKIDVRGEASGQGAKSAEP
jgi:type I restriction enzyme S subunit